MTKKLKYASVKKNISLQRALENAVSLLNKASEKALRDNDTLAMASAGSGWAQLFQGIVQFESAGEEEGGLAELEIEDVRGLIQLANPVGFGPNREYEDEDDED